jgi:hypothetical protein
VVDWLGVTALVKSELVAVELVELGVDDEEFDSLLCCVTPLPKDAV